MTVTDYLQLNSPDKANETWLCATCILHQFSDSIFESSRDSIPDFDNVSEHDLDSQHRISDIKGMKIAHLNINSLTANLEDLRIFL